MKKILNLSQVVVVPVVTGALGVTSKILKGWLKKLDVHSSIDLLQKAALLGTAKIVRQVSPRGLRLEMYKNYQLNQDKHNNDNNDNN